MIEVEIEVEIEIDLEIEIGIEIEIKIEIEIDLEIEREIEMFVCLFVWGKTRKSILRSLSLEGSNNPWEWSQTESGTGIELYPTGSCFQHETPPENTPRPLV